MPNIELNMYIEQRKNVKKYLQNIQVVSIMMSEFKLSEMLCGQQRLFITSLIRKYTAIQLLFRVLSCQF